MSTAIRKWGLLPIGFDRPSIAFSLFVFMAIVEVILSLSGLLMPDQNWRGWAFANFGLYEGQAFYGYLTYALLHGNFFHMAFNMMVFAQTGAICERAMGHGRFLVFTSLAAIVAGYFGIFLAQFLRGDPVLLIGFSGVVFAYIGVVFRQVITRAKDKLAAVLDLLKRNVLLLLFIVVPFLMPSLGISGEAHLGGFLFGFLLAPIFMKK